MARVLIRTQPWGTVWDRTGNALTGIAVHIKNTDGTDATTWSAQTGGTSTTGSPITDINGAVPGWIEEGEYDVTIPPDTLRVQAAHSYRHPVAYFGDATDSEYASAPTLFQVVQYFGDAGPVTGLLPQAALTRLKSFDTFVDDSMEANASQVIFTNLGAAKRALTPLVANEGDILVQAGNTLRGYQARAIGHITALEAQTSGSQIDFAWATDVAGKSARDTGTVVRQFAAYHAEDPSVGISGKVGAVWSVNVPNAIHSRDSLTLGTTTTVEGHLASSASIGASTVTLETGHGAGGFYNYGSASGGSGAGKEINTSPFAAGQSVVIDVGRNAEVKTIAPAGVTGDVLTFTSTLSKAHAQYCRVAVVDANGFGMFYMLTGQVRTESTLRSAGLQSGQCVIVNADGSGYYQMAAQTGGTVSTPSASTSRLYQNGAKVLAYKHEDGTEASVYTGHRTILNVNTTLTALHAGIIARTSTASAATFTLPAANGVPAGTMFTFKDEAGDAATNNITVSRAGSDDFEGGVTTKVVNTNFGVLRVYTGGGTRWFTA